MPIKYPNTSSGPGSEKKYFGLMGKSEEIYSLSPEYPAACCGEFNLKSISNQ